MEESDFDGSFSDIKDDDYRYDDDSGGIINNDSDFWRARD